MTFTVLGAEGLIGAALVSHLRSRAIKVRSVGREDSLDGDLGHVVDCVGVTADFRDRPLDTVEAHVGRAVDFLRHATFRSYLYLSSTRVYRRCTSSSEDMVIPVRPDDAEDLYAISKLAGESLVLTVGSASFRVARISNVVGSDPRSKTFLASVVREAILTGHIEVGLAPDSARDLVALADVVHALPIIAVGGTHRVYNVASGSNLTVKAIVDEVSRLTGATVDYSKDAEALSFPPVSIERIQTDLGFVPTDPMVTLPGLVAAARQELMSP